MGFLLNFFPLYFNIYRLKKQKKNSLSLFKHFFFKNKEKLSILDFFYSHYKNRNYFFLMTLYAQFFNFDFLNISLDINYFAWLIFIKLLMLSEIVEWFS